MTSVIVDLESSPWLDVRRSVEVEPFSDNKSWSIEKTAPGCIEQVLFGQGMDTFALLGAAKFHHMPEALADFEHA